MRLIHILFLPALISIASCSRSPKFDISQAPAPLFRDPVFDGAADPTVIYNGEADEWLVFYTQRRAALELKGTEYCYGTAIGIAGSADNGKSWTYRGTAHLPQPDSGLNSFWAPQVFRNPEDHSWHMIVSYIRGVYDNWGGERQIFHYSTTDLKKWTRVASTGIDGCIDASVTQLDDGTWKMWFKDEQHGSFTYSATSKNLVEWQRSTGKGDTLIPEISNRRHEAPIVFRWKESWWMITDPTYEEYTGLDVFRSEDATHWTFNNTILNTPGRRPDDNDQGRHPDVQVIGDRVFIFYFTHPGRIYDRPGVSFPELMTEDPDENRLRYRRSSLQVAELEWKNGKVDCDRNKYATPQ